MKRRPQEQQELTATLVCLECREESDEASRWRAYFHAGELLVYCACCAAREFDP